MNCKKIFSLFLTAILLGTGSMTGIVCNAEENNIPTYTIPDSSYSEYIETNKGKENNATGTIDIFEDVYSFHTIYQQAEFPFHVEKDGYYNFTFDFCCSEEVENNPTFTVLIDGDIPFIGASQIEVNRYWDVGAISSDSNGNSIRGEMTVNEDWHTYSLRDASGIESLPYRFYLASGEHTITFVLNDGKCSLKNIKALGDNNLISYDEYIKNNDIAVYNGELLFCEAENVYLVNSREVISNNEMQSYLTTPNSHSKNLLNVLGGSNWKKPNTSVVWKIQAPKSALYKISFRFKQDSYQGFTSYRSLLVNGAIPYTEAKSLAFDYDEDWQTLTFDKYVFLNEGPNMIELTCTLGESANLLKATNQVITELNSLYSDLLMVVGTQPDNYRDYHLEDEIPNLKENIEKIAANIDTLCQDVMDVFGENRGQISALQDASRQLKDMAANIRSITKGSRISRLKSNISSIASFAAKLQGGPLQLDSFVLSGEEEIDLHSEKFFSKFKYSVMRFISSFVEDYNTVSGNNGKRTISVWISTGRDQLQVMKSMVESDFSPNYGINVKMQLVTGSVIQATLAGKGPDVALGRTETDVMNFAIRNAICDLKEFEGYSDVIARFSKTAMEPFTYKGSVYALPATQSFDMMFVRTDIFADLGLNVPETWKELITVTIPVLQRKNLSVGLGLLNKSANINASNLFYTLLCQSGGTLYTEDRLKTNMATPSALEAFDTAVSFYREYSIPQEYDFLNRFRTGESPLIVDSYINYNNIKAGAPELEGLWKMHPIPGTEVNGKINRTQLMSSSAEVIFKNAKDKDACWEFLKWFTSDTTQLEYGINIESVLGPSGRYATANLSAMKGLGWGHAQLSLLEEQRANSQSFVHIPGSYYTAKEINNAIVISATDTSIIPREKLLEALELIDNELTRKRHEFEK